MLEAGIKSDLDLGLQYDEVQYDTEEVTYESEVHVEDVHLGDSNVYFNVGLESESDHSEVLSLPSTSEETVTVTVRQDDLFSEILCTGCSQKRYFYPLPQTSKSTSFCEHPYSFKIFST